MTVQLTVIGCNQIGTSIGLALSQESKQLTRVAHDRVHENTQKALKMGAFDRVSQNLRDALSGADILLLAVPCDEIAIILEQAGDHLKDGCVVLDTSLLRTAPAEWAKEHVPAGRFFISFTPTLNPAYLFDTNEGVDAAHADLFKNSQVMISASGGTDADAIKLAYDLAVLIGSRPFFVDPAELEGLAAATYFLPRICATALVNATMDQPGWNEGRKLAHRTYAQATQGLTEINETTSLGQSLLLNSRNVIRVIDDLIASLDELRQSLASGDVTQTKEYLEHASQSRENWLKQRQKGEWLEGEEKVKIPSASERLTGMFLGGFFTRRKKG